VLSDRLQRLYGHQPGHAAWFDNLMAARPAALQALDAAREDDPNWFCAPTMLGYSAYVDQLGGKMHGDLRGV
jgi:amylosucrase